MNVFVYCNIKNRTLSVRALDGEMKGRVIASCERLLLKDVKFKSSAAGRQRVRETGRKNVHAGLVGELLATWGTEVREDTDNDTRLALSGIKRASFGAWPGGAALTYDPRKHDGFVKRGGKRVVASADLALLDACKLEAANPVYA